MKNRHGVTENTDKNNGKRQRPQTSGAMDRYLDDDDDGAKKRPREFNAGVLHDAICKILVAKNLPFELVESKEFQELLYVVHQAKDLTQLKLPSADTIAAKVSDPWRLLIS
jgi:hypothetical protein